MVNQNISIEDAKIIFRNFSGKEDKFNQAGDRNFCVILDKDLAERLVEDGWNVRLLQPREEGDEPIPYLQVKVNYKNIPPKIVLVSSRGKNILDESTVGMVDWAEIENVDLIIKPYNWDINGKKGVKGYVKTMYISILEDEFESKYYDTVDETPQVNE